MASVQSYNFIKQDVPYKERSNKIGMSWYPSADFSPACRSEVYPVESVSWGGAYSAGACPVRPACPVKSDFAFI